jgi:hypothetical protein
MIKSSTMALVVLLCCAGAARAENAKIDHTTSRDSTASVPGPSDSRPAPVDGQPIDMPGAPLGIGWAFLYGYQGVPAAPFMPLLRACGGGMTKVYLFWNQIEPQPGKYDWTAVDALADQLQSPEEGLIAVFSSSQWATERPSTMLPPSPAKNPDDYYRFIFDLVSHCRGRVRYWQNDCEPNNPVFWSGTKEQFVDELKLFYRAVKAADPQAVVVAGGYDGLFNPPGLPPLHNQETGLAFFDYVLRAGRDAFDVFDLRLYGNPYTIPARVDFIRQKMLALGFDKPIIATEYGGPGFFEFPENRPYVSLVGSWSQSVAGGDNRGLSKSQPPGGSIAALYQRMDSLPPQTQMFMQGCSPELEAKYQRIQSRQVVMRNLFALSAGVQRTLYWQLVAMSGERDNLMTLMYGKIGLLGVENGGLNKRFLTTDVFARFAALLAGVRRVKRIELADQPSLFLFEINRAGKGPAYVLWEKRDAFSGEDAPPTTVEIPWNHGHMSALDAFGHKVPVKVTQERLHVAVSDTPIFLTPSG